MAGRLRASGAAAPLKSPQLASDKPSGRDKVITLVTQFDPDFEEPGPSDLQGILTVLSGSRAGEVFRLDALEYMIGRDEHADISIGDPGLSRAHGRLYRRGGQFYVEDVGSTNGTFVNARKLQDPHRLSNGDRIQIGQNTVLRFSLQDRLEQEATQRLYEMTVRDALTELYNRRHLDDQLEAEFAYAKRHKSDLCVLLLDVDHFKRINDTHGHGVGDEVLVAVARGLEHIVRKEDLVARYGGEEFVIIARGIDVNGGLAFAERVRAYLASLDIATQAGNLSVTASFGVAHTDNHPYGSVRGLLSASDEALYRAKARGRNCVELAEGPSEDEETLSIQGTGPIPSGERRPPNRAVTAPIKPRPKTEPIR